MGMGGGGMGTGGMESPSTAVPPLKYFTCRKCSREFLHRDEIQVTCPYCREVQPSSECGQCGQKTGNAGNGKMK